jgi:hypothetical protein
MKNLNPVVLGLLFTAGLFAGCASSSSDAGISGQSDKLTPTVELRQVSGANEGWDYSGPTKIKYQIDITNPYGDPIKMVRLQLQTMGSGSYRLQGMETPVNQVVGPNKRVTMSFWANAYATGGGRQNEPVTVKGLALFETSEGQVRKMFVQNIAQDFFPGTQN